MERNSIIKAYKMKKFKVFTNDLILLTVLIAGVLTLDVVGVCNHDQC